MVGAAEKQESLETRIQIFVVQVVRTGCGDNGFQINLVALTNKKNRILGLGSTCPGYGDSLWGIDQTLQVGQWMPVCPLQGLVLMLSQ